MNEHTKNYLGWVAIMFVGVLSYAVLSYVRTYGSSIEPGTYRSFSVAGEGKVVAVPDVATFSFSIITEGGKDLAALQKENTTKGNKIIDFIKSSGVAAKDIKTEGYSVYPRYTNYTCRQVSTPMMQGGTSGVGIAAPSIAIAYPVDKVCPPPEISGYSISQTVSVKIRDFVKAGDILTGAVSNGANSVSQLSFDIDDRDKVELEARAAAIEKAKVKAQAVAKAGGFRLGRLLAIDEGSSPVYYARALSFDSGAKAESAPAPTIEPGSQDIIINVTLRYEIR
ncbi:MAG: SIMPL domain-containing protein [bacterium]|nr:SIMPL domain-containing protein [bacterium]